MQSRGILNTTTVDVSKRFVLKNIFSYRENSGSFANDLDGTPLTLLLMNPSRMAGCLRYTTVGPTYTGFASNRSAFGRLPRARPARGNPPNNVDANDEFVERRPGAG